MKKVIASATICILLIGLFSFSTPGKGFSKNENISEVGKYVYFRVYVLAQETYYFSNVIWIEGDDNTEYFEKLEGQKTRFKKFMKNEYNREWTAPVQDYNDSDEDRLIGDRKTRIKQAGNNVKYIDL